MMSEYRISKKLILVGLWTMLAFSVVGQTVVSRVERVGTTGVVGALVRAVDDRYVMTHSESYGSPATHYFVLHDELFMYQYRMAVNLPQLFGNQADRVVVKDMRVYGGRCYFCGSYRQREGEPQYDVNGNVVSPGYSSTGYVACFDLDEMMSGGGRMYMRPILMTDSLTRMVVYDPGLSETDVAVAAIGAGAVFGQSVPVLVELHRSTNPGSSANWTEYRLTPSLPMEEQFHDITVSDNYLRIVSGFGEEQDLPATCRSSFMIHSSKKMGYYHQYAEHMGMAENAYYFSENPRVGIAMDYRHEADRIRICSMSDDTCCVAMGVSGLTSWYGDVVMLKLDPQIEPVSAEQLACFTYPSVAEMAYWGEAGVVGLLACSWRNGDGHVVLTTTQPEAGLVRLDWDGETIHSISPNGEGRMAVAGTSATRRMRLLLEDMGSAWTPGSESCAEVEETGSWPAIFQQPEQQPYEWESSVQPCVWGIAFYTSEQLSATVDCTKTVIGE